MKKHHIVCVDDETIVLQSLRRELRQDPFFGEFSIRATRLST
ncbi:MAG TPA: hypothetical protein PLV73_05035 [Treponemataceae bacterium]|jgi:hypothetical protein|nr:MAG: hypothetical protein BWY20_00241 [Spirochaetes bacterium ADurb.Bin215]HOF84953.1 hypothetical protein [Treponemataceae bacterium]HOS35989.1 hypothetical protein [Treponemataceae bacterium]HOU39129.1 hypothetical protein [Treponemataceae bacterium]HPA10170.1 hypothetical protein [Treponemataceae bacterium]